MNLDTNEISNKNLNVFARATTVTDEFDQSETIRSLTEDEDVIIMTVAPVTRKIKFLHSPCNLGGTRVRPDNKIVALDGFDDKATPVLIDEACLTTPVELRTPSVANLHAIKTVENIRNSSTLTSGRKNFHHLNFVILPPFLATKLIDLSTRDPEDIFVECISLIEEHDTTYASDEEYNKANNECRHILSFLWSASKSLIPSTIFVTANDDSI